MNRIYRVVVALAGAGLLASAASPANEPDPKKTAKGVENAFGSALGEIGKGVHKAGEAVKKSANPDNEKDKDAKRSGKDERK